MIFRVLILVFAFNAVLPSAYAMGAMDGCMPNKDGNSSAMVMHDSNMACDMVDMEENCQSAQCLSSCMINLMPLPSSELQEAFSLNLLGQPPLKRIHFYKIIYPVQTPPPLV